MSGHPGARTAEEHLRRLPAPLRRQDRDDQRRMRGGTAEPQVAGETGLRMRPAAKRSDGEELPLTHAQRESQEKAYLTRLGATPRCVVIAHGGYVRDG